MNVLLKIKEFQSFIIRKLSKPYREMITPVQACIIDYLINNNKVYQKDIEKLLNLRRSTISGILHTMEKNGLIEKKGTKEDARLKEITLTYKAKLLHDNITSKFEKLNNDICKNISNDELNIFLSILDKMIDNIKER